jgi:hypothetical protein
VPPPLTGDIYGPPVILAQATPGFDCLVGEKMWRNRSFMWDVR